MKRSAWLVVALVALALPASANATFPGQNGKIAFQSSADGDSEIYTINPDGSGVQQVTNNTVSDSGASWSPDGQRLLFTRADGSDRDIWGMDANGTNQALVLDYPGAPPTGPTWSPDGSKIVFTVDDHCDEIVGSGGVFTANADGSNLEFLTCGVDDGACCASWSPDGTRIAWSEASAGFSDVWVHTLGGGNQRLTADDFDDQSSPDWSPSGHKIIFTFVSESGGGVQLHTMNPDGSADAPLRSGAAAAWSPDGTKIAFDDNGPPAGIWTSDANATGATFLTNGRDPSWQPIPVNSYPRPKGATPFRASLTTAYKPCTSPNRAHGPPLAFPSCNPPQQTSDYLTVGTADANARPALNEGYLKLDAMPGVPGGPDDADVGIDLFMDDVFTKPALADYTGELRARVLLQITDKDNTPHPGGPGAGTTTQIPLEVTVACTVTAATNEGSSCTTTTSADALAPGTVKEGRRAIWQLGRTEVYDGGSDGDAQTPAGDTLFATQGIFVP